MSKHPLDARLHNLDCEELRYVMALLRAHAGLRGNYVNPAPWGVTNRGRAGEIGAMVDELVTRLIAAQASRGDS